MDSIMQRIHRNVRFFQHVGELQRKAMAQNSANKPLPADIVRGQKSRETMSQRAFVRSFGDKVKKVRYSDRADFVGMVLLGKQIGFMVVEIDGVRKLRLIDVDGVKIHITNRFLPLKDSDSLSNLQRGLLKWVR